MTGDVVMVCDARWRRLPVVSVSWTDDDQLYVDKLGRKRSPCTLPSFRKGKKPGNAGKRLRAMCSRKHSRMEADSERRLDQAKCAVHVHCMALTDPSYERPCQRCGQLFTPAIRYQHQRFCGRQCGIQSAHAVNRERELTPWQERFWNFVPAERQPDECWEWTGTKMRKSPYGRLTTRKPKTMAAHRASYEIHFGPIPDGLKVCHRCDNPPCVNPAHLFLGTQADNVADMITKGRRRTDQGGEQHPFATHTDEEVREIRRLRGAGLTRRAIAEQVGVKESYVKLIISGRSRAAA